MAKKMTNASSFAEEMAGIKPLNQDKVFFSPADKKNISAKQSPKLSTDSTHSSTATNNAPAKFHFSDEYEPYIDESQTLKFVQEGFPSYFAKILRRGDIAPELILDLHGYNKQQAQYDIALLIDDCIKQQIPCACIVHGVSGGILKKKVPHYLMQHPDVVAFHQAPLEWGGKGAVVLMVNIGEELDILTESFTASGQVR
jgi:DNA-nicking Smr family endonuclease